MVPFVASQWISSLRLLSFLHHKQFRVHPTLNLKLYFVGMFYNFFIPGGIGGDAFKVYFLHKRFKWPIKQLAATLVTDRTSGLLTIFILCTSGATVFLSQIFPWYLSIVIVLGAIFISVVFIRKIFSVSPYQFSKGVFFSVGVQCLQILTVVCIILSLKFDEAVGVYIFLFLLSSLLSLFSVGGLGVREFVFFQFSKWMNYDAEFSVTIGLLFNIISLMVSLAGVYFQLFDMQLNQKVGNQSL